LNHLGYKVFFIINITDIDDKIFERAEEEKINHVILTHNYTQAFLEDLSSLKIDTVSKFAKASEHLDQAVIQIQGLLEKQFAYRVDGDVYFDTSKFKDYGKLSHQTPATLRLRRLDPDPRKKNQSDFPLWRSSVQRGPRWPSPFGNGRPGWHIEDTAISLTYFGPQYDIHGGAVDLVFPHHEAEIAQAEGLTGRKPFVRFWVHTGTLDIRGKKMSKSLGNFITVREMLKEVRPEVLRLYFAMHHYRDKVNFDEMELEEAGEMLDELWKVLDDLERALKHSADEREDRMDELIQLARIYERSFCRMMDDDFNTPKAIEAIIEFCKKINVNIERKRSRHSIQICIDTLKHLLSILGILK